MHTRFTTTLLLTAALATLGAACGSDDDTSVTQADLDGRTFTAVSFDPDGIVDGSTITIAFEDGALAVMADCNTQRSAYTLDGDTLLVEAMMSTMMACDEPLMAQDTALATFLSSSPTIALDGDTLTITSDGDGTVLTLEA